MTAIWKLGGTPMLPPDPTPEQMASALFGSLSPLIDDPDRYVALLMGYDETAGLWPEPFRRRFCDTMPPLALAPGVVPPDDVAELLGVFLVSRAARHVLDTAGCDAGYGDVTGPAPGAWFTLWPRVFADPVDRARTPGRAVPVQLPDGMPGTVWQRDLPAPGEWPVLTTYRDDFVPPTPLFRGAGTTTTFASDGLAEQLLRVGLSGVELQDVTSGRGQRERVLKRL